MTELFYKEETANGLKIIIEHGEDGYFAARCPSLKGCWSQGKTEDDARRNIREAVELYLEPDDQSVVIEDQRIAEAAA
jgi:predicted RNase H-like HicB family nuclease